MTKPTQKKRLSRYVPDKEAFPNLALKERDYLILQLVYDHRFLSGELLWHLLQTDTNFEIAQFSVGSDGKQRPTKYGFGQQALSKRLKQLYNSRYLERHYITDQPMGRGHGAPRAIYGLGPKSPKILHDQFEIPFKISRGIIESNKVKSPFLRHALEIAKFRVIIELACNQSNGEVELLFWEQGQCLRDSVYGRNTKGVEQKFSVYPDAFFALNVKGKGKASFFLELDTGSMTISSKNDRLDIQKKVLGFWYYRKSKRFNNRYYFRKYGDGKIAGLGIRTLKEQKISEANSESIKGFTALFLTPGVLKPDCSVKGRIANMLASFPQFGKNISSSSLYWFSTLNMFDIEYPEFVFNKCWITPNPKKGLQSLIT